MRVKVVLIQKGLLDNQNPDFFMGWPGLYLLDNIDQLGSVCSRRLLSKKSSNLSGKESSQVNALMHKCVF